jgi:hypothetical protein
VRFLDESKDAFFMCNCPACNPRPPTQADRRRQEADNLRYEQMLARDKAWLDQRSSPTTEKPEIRGCVFAKSCDLPDGLIDYNNPGGFVPPELLTQYGAFAVLGSDFALTDTDTSLGWIGGSSSATALTSQLGGQLATASTELDVLAIVLMPNTNPPDSARYTLDQYPTLTTAITRVRLHLERLTDGSIRAYGFYTGKNRDWENVPVVAAIADGERFVVELDQGLKLIFNPGETSKAPTLKEAPPLMPVWVYPPTKIADQILVNPVHPPAYRDAVVWFPESAIAPFYIAYCVKKVCDHPDMMLELAEYIAGEMNRNINHPSVLKMKQLNSYDVVEETRKYMELPWYAMAGATSPQTIAYANATAAFALWTERVGQDRPWDHKPKIRDRFGGNFRHKQGGYDFYYDIWSNIHYGYVGLAGGFSESALLDGAGGEQIASDSFRKVTQVLFDPNAEKKLPGPSRSADIDGLRAWDDAPDRISISIGMKLYKQYPNGTLAAKAIMAEVLAVTPKEWGKGVRVHTCKTN